LPVRRSLLPAPGRFRLPVDLGLEFLADLLYGLTNLVGLLGEAVPDQRASQSRSSSEWSIVSLTSWLTRADSQEPGRPASR